MVLRCSVAGRAAVLKASLVDAGRVLNEGNYLSELRGRARRLHGTADGFAELLLPPRQLELHMQMQHNSHVNLLRPAFFVMEAVQGGSLQDLARAGKAFTLQETAMLGAQLVRRLQVMHTQENSLGLVHSDIKPANVLYDEARALFFLVDFDCTTCIPSIAPRKKGALKKVQGSYLFTGIDALNGDYPSPKADLDALGQLLVWCLLGASQWKTPVTNQSGLAAEKLKWRNSNRSVEKREYGSLLPHWLCTFIEKVEQLESTVDRPDYSELAAIFDAVAGHKFGPASLPAPQLQAHSSSSKKEPEPEKENGASASAARPSSPRSTRKKPAKKEDKRKKEAKAVSPTRMPKPAAKVAGASSSPGPNLRPRRAGTKYA